MTDKPINLNKVRKARAKDAARKQADENAVKFGRTSQEKSKTRAEITSLRDHLDAHKRDP